MRPLTQTKRLARAVVILLTIPYSALGVVTSDDVGTHQTTPGELAFGLNLDGVALLADDVPAPRTIDDLLPICSSALISDRHLLTAAHCFDEDRDGEIDRVLTFFPLAIAFETPAETFLLGLDVDKVQFPAEWPETEADLAIVELMNDAPASIPRYSLYGAQNEVGQAIVIAGYGAAGHGATGEDLTFPIAKRAGMNRYEAIRDDKPGVDFLAYDFDSGLETNNGLAVIGFESDLGFGDDEVLSAHGDSGGPVFIDGAIAGVISFVTQYAASDFTDKLDWSWGEVGFDTRVSNFRDFLLQATDGQAVFAGDPSPAGDFDNDGSFSVMDIDALVAAIVGGTNDPLFDLTADENVDAADVSGWLAAAASANGFTAPYLLGDANLDGIVNVADLNALGQNWLGHPDTWTSGDFNADGTVDAGDLNKIGQNWQASISLAADTESVPEPRAWCLLAFGLAFIMCGIRQH